MNNKNEMSITIKMSSHYAVFGREEQRERMHSNLNRDGSRNGSSNCCEPKATCQGFANKPEIRQVTKVVILDIKFF